MERRRTRHDWLGRPRVFHSRLMAPSPSRAEFDNDSASSQVFIFLFEPDMTPAGKNFLDGRYGTFGYTIQGAEFLRQVQEGDQIIEAKVVEGLENLKRD